jgi:hypothetical protein
MKQLHTKTYLFTFIATLAIFVVAFGVSTFVTKKKTEELKAAEDRISINILSMETQYELLKDSSCKTFDRKALREELDTLASKLEFMEEQVGPQNPEVFRLKRYYSLLQIKDYLLTKKMSEQCNFDTIFILYFYANKDCSECRTQEYLLRAIRNEYPEVEIYSFDYDLDLSAVRTLITLHNIPPEPPVIDINSIVYEPFENLDAIHDLMETLTATTTATSTATTTKKKAQ